MKDQNIPLAQVIGTATSTLKWFFGNQIRCALAALANRVLTPNLWNGLMADK